MPPKESRGNAAFCRENAAKPETKRSSRQGDNQAARSRRRCARRKSIAAETWQMPRFRGHVAARRAAFWARVCPLAPLIPDAYKNPLGVFSLEKGEWRKKFVVLILFVVVLLLVLVLALAIRVKERECVKVVFGR